jgi:hypothetical protein
MVEELKQQLKEKDAAIDELKAQNVELVRSIDPR